jgi:hypothetical protein
VVVNKDPRTRIRLGLSGGTRRGQCNVTSLAANFVELSFCYLRCNARCDRPHEYLLVVNICP